jgi:uncharacterized protein (DUF433 family)
MSGSVSPMEIPAYAWGRLSPRPEVLGGAPVFVGTRVPVRTLLDCLEGGDTLDEFLEDVPGVRREQAFES